MTIKGITEKKILPRLGKIRTGIKKQTGAGVDYPEEVPYFVLNPVEEVLDKAGNVIGTKENQHIIELIRLFGEQPHEMRVAFPIDDEDAVFGHYLKWWSGDVKKRKATLACKGDGEYACYSGKERVSGMDADYYPPGKNRICNPALCPQAQPQGKYNQPLCKPNMNLMFVVPDYSLYGVFQMDTTSFQAIQNIVSCIAVARSALRLEGIGTIAGVPLRLFRNRTPNKFGGVNYIISLEVDRRELDEQKKLYLEKKPSTLGLAIDSYMIEQQLLDEPNYDLLPKEDFPHRLQTGELEVLPPPIDKSVWLNNDETRSLFQQLAEKNGVPLTDAKMLATAKKHETEESLIAYLKGQLV